MDAPVFESKYKFEDVPNGFNITAPDRNPTYVRFNGKVFFLGETQKPYTHKFGVFEYSKLISSIAANLMKDWQGKALPNGRPNFKIKKWAQTKTAIALSKRVNERRVALMAKADQACIQAQRNYFSATGKYHSYLIHPALYQDKNKYVLHDISTYRAAAMTVEDMNFDGEKFHGWYSLETLGAVDNWMKIYSGKYDPNTSLRKTLMNLPGGIPYYMLKYMYMREIKRPYQTRLELLAYLNTIQSHQGYLNRDIDILNRSNAKQIHKALKLVQKQLHSEKTPLRKTNAITRLLTYIFDCTNTHNGHIVGMAHKSIRWHRNNGYEREKKFCKYAPDTLTKHPTIEVPQSTNIRFLDCVQAIFDESVNMNHCVSSYAGKAVEGHCYLFHVDYRGESATVEVSPAGGGVIQSHGPSNMENAASKWGRRMLNKWAEALKPVITNELVETPF